MPTYQYRCTQCDHELEVVQKFSDSALTVCPSCQGSLRKIYNAVGVVFKGSGFYKTDSRAAGSSSDSSSNGSTKTDSASSSGSNGSNGSSSSAGSSSSSGSASSSTASSKAATPAS
ncbi:FmdB family transcriptional regulator [Auraticoccus sp. F435]|uniref:FmdB family transcriptional regulator n=1 Tax=Auraticoccus cholistanensis TaxID=2656650 RepID=A0A6A9UXV6_9ACTN|nr:FmdB family zinc ribbon protein [Auraticoccus cholistanensis]MVA76605.1 FmdB family transcriptional regulator [Auraticoccus cholistanensis]